MKNGGLHAFPERRSVGADGRLDGAGPGVMHGHTTTEEQARQASKRADDAAERALDAATRATCILEEVRTMVHRLRRRALRRQFPASADEPATDAGSSD